jgi:hypothetical protein
MFFLSRETREVLEFMGLAYFFYDKKIKSPLINARELSRMDI